MTKEFRFQNPLHPNWRHINTMSGRLKLPCRTFTMSLLKPVKPNSRPLLGQVPIGCLDRPMRGIP